MTAITEFYSEQAPDNAGRYLSDILNFDVNQLESVHNYIQWLFPLAEPSQFNMAAPLLTLEDQQAFSNDNALQARLQQSYVKMLEFYGLKRNDENKEVVRSSSFGAAAQNWITPDNHNFLRITRILKALSSLGAKDDARQFLQILDQLYKDHGNIITERTFTFWQKAVT